MLRSPLLERARAILADIEKDAEDLAPRIANSNRRRAKDEPEQQLGLFDRPQSLIDAEIAKLDLDRLTPIEALCLLRDLKNRL